MVTVKLWGGLGNQLFQYAYGYSLAKKNNTKIILDVSWFATQNLRKPEIMNFNISYDKIEETWENNKKIAFLNNRQINRLIRIPYFALYNLGDVLYLKESRLHYCDSVANFHQDNVYLDGYWQCPDYFNHIFDDLQTLFTIKNLSKDVLDLGTKLSKNNTIAVHVRRGDYPKHKQPFTRLAIIDDSYYKKAITYMNSQCPNNTMYLFSNGKDDAIEMINRYTNTRINVIDLKNISALDEWYLMKCCCHQIIGNSTFSWWAAYLNNNPEKIVCAPNKYMGNDDIIPKNWVKIDCNEES